MGGIKVDHGSNDGEDYLTADALPVLYGGSLITRDALKAGEIEDKSKASWFKKAIASLQITWFLTQLIGRAASHLTVTLLELLTLGYVVCALGVYYFWWHKPFDMQVPFIDP